MDLLPTTLGIMGKPAASYSRLRKMAMAQKWGGVHRKTIRKRIPLTQERWPVSAASAIRGAVAPAAPPMTMFWGVRGLSQIV